MSHANQPFKGDKKATKIIIMDLRFKPENTYTCDETSLAKTVTETEKGFRV